MKINVEHITEKPLVLSGEESLEAFPVLLGMQKDRECVFKGPVRFDITAQREFDHLRVTGKVQVLSLLSCSRCLAEFEAEINSSFTIFYRKAIPGEISLEEETELDEQDLVSATYSGGEIDLNHELEEQVAMEIPLKPLCSQACKGLCTVCGEDLNSSACLCSRETVNMKFSALKNFKVNR